MICCLLKIILFFHYFHYILPESLCELIQLNFFGFKFPLCYKDFLFFMGNFRSCHCYYGADCFKFCCHSVNHDLFSSAFELIKLYFSTFVCNIVFEADQFFLRQCWDVNTEEKLFFNFGISFLVALLLILLDRNFKLAFILLKCLEFFDHLCQLCCFLSMFLLALV